MNNIVNLLFAFTFLIFGLILVFNGGYFSEKHGVHIDFGELNTLIGLLFSGIGIYLLILVLKKDKSN